MYVGVCTRCMCIYMYIQYILLVILGGCVNVKYGGWKNVNNF